MATRVLALLIALGVATPAMARRATVTLAAGDCVQPYDAVVDIFDLLAQIDVTLGRLEPGIGCDAECDGDVDEADVDLTARRLIEGTPPTFCTVDVRFGR